MFDSVCQLRVSKWRTSNFVSREVGEGSRFNEEIVGSDVILQADNWDCREALQRRSPTETIISFFVSAD